MGQVEADVVSGCGTHVKTLDEKRTVVLPEEAGPGAEAALTESAPTPQFAYPPAAPFPEILRDHSPACPPDRREGRRAGGFKAFVARLFGKSE